MQGADFAPAVTLSGDNRFAVNPDIAITKSGRSVVAWLESDTESTPAGVRAAVQDGSGRWDRAQIKTLSGPHKNAVQPSVATSGERAVVAWAEGKPSHRTIMISRYDGQWSSPVRVPSDRAANPEVALAPDGTINVAWTQQDGERTAAMFAVGSISKFDSKKLSRTNEDVVSADLALSDSGKPTVTWYSTKDNRYSVRASSPSNAGSKAVTLSTDSSDVNAVQPRIASRAGTTMVTWQQINGSEPQHVEFSSLKTDGSWSAPTRLPEAGDGAANPVIGVDGHGLASIVWIKSGACDQGMLSRQTGPSSWAPAVEVTDSKRDNDNEQIAVSSSGAAIVGWPGVDPSEHPGLPPAQVNVRDATGAWGGVQTLSPQGSKTSGASVAISDAGQLAAIWSLGDDATRSRIDVATTLTPR